MVIRSLRVACAAGIAALVTSCGGAASSTGTTTTTTTTNTTTPVQTTSVLIQNSAFSPPNIRVSPSATVTFTNQDATAHNVTFTTGGITSTSDFSSGAKNIVMPATPGTYAFRCTIHAGMNGSVLVQ